MGRYSYVAFETIEALYIHLDHMHPKKWWDSNPHLRAPVTYGSYHMTDLFFFNIYLFLVI